MIRTYANFVKNTIEPMLDKMSDILWLCNEKGLPIDRDTLSELIEKAFLGHMVSEIFKSVVQLLIVGIICGTVLAVYR